MRTVLAPRSRAVAATRAKSASCSSSARSACGCSRISARKTAPGGSATTVSGDDTGLAADADAFDLEVVVQDEQVGLGADLQPPELWPPEHASRHRGG